MNRVIKFRGWDKPNGLRDGRMRYDIGVDENGHATHDEYGTYPNMEIMQFTGLKDKNGVDIYEGDILKNIDNCINDNKYYECIHQFSFFALANNGIVYGFGYINDDDRDPSKLEVIGNIYENAGLLK